MVEGALEVVTGALEVVTGALVVVTGALVVVTGTGAGEPPVRTDMDILLVKVTPDPSKGSVPACMAVTYSL